MRLALVLLLVLAGAAPPVGAQPTLPPRFALDDATGGDPFDYPVAVAFASDGRMFVAEKRGVVWVVQDGARAPTPFLNLQGEVLDSIDRGLLGLAVDAEDRVLLLYTVDRGGGDSLRADAFGRLTRYRALPDDPNRADPASRTVLLGATMAEGIPTCAGTHGIGTVAVGADGTLLVGAGDGGAPEFVDTGGHHADCFGPGRFPLSEDVGAFRAQRVESLAGKLLRLDPETGLGLPSNPFWTGDGRDNASKVWAYGLRNPFRFAVRPGGRTDPADGEPGLIVAGDVGWETWEELDVVHGGENFGWPCYEGPAPNPRYQAADPAACAAAAPATPPVAYFHRSDPALSQPPGRAARSVTGGAFTGAGTYPPAYVGRYVYGEFSRGWTAVAAFDDEGALVADTLFSPDTGRVVNYVYDPTTQALHFVDIVAGRIYRLLYVNAAPVAEASADLAAGFAPLAVAFSVEGTADPDGDALAYAWDFGDGATSDEPAPRHTYAAPGRYTARLTVSDGIAEATAALDVTVWADPGPFGITVVAPNPSDGRVTVRLVLDAPGAAQIEVFDSLGRRVATGEASAAEPGELAVPLDLGRLGAGVYLVRATQEATGLRSVQRLAVIR